MSNNYRLCFYSCIKTIEGHKDDINAAVFSPNDRYIASASKDMTIKIWDSETGNCIQTLEHKESVTDVVYCPNGEYILSTTNDGVCMLWKVSTGQCIHSSEGRVIRGAYGVFSYDGKCFVTTSKNNKNVKIWDTSTGQCIQTIEGHGAKVCTAAFCPNRNFIVIASDDNTIKIWDFLPLQRLIDEIRERFKDRQLTIEEKAKYNLE